MAVPKYKISKARGRSRCSASYKVAAPTLVECPECHELKKPHTVCKKCGTYKGSKVIETEKKEKTTENK